MKKKGHVCVHRTCPFFLRKYAALDTIRINATPHALLLLRRTAFAHAGIGDITRSLLWRDTGSLGGTVHVVLGDIAHIAMSIIRLTTATAYTHVDVLLPINPIHSLYTGATHLDGGSSFPRVPVTESYKLSTGPDYARAGETQSYSAKRCFFTGQSQLITFLQVRPESSTDVEPPFKARGRISIYSKKQNKGLHPLGEW